MKFFRNTHEDAWMPLLKPPCFFLSTHNTWNGLVARRQAALFSNVGATPHLQARFLPPGSFSGKCLSNLSTIPVQPAAKAVCRDEKSIWKQLKPVICVSRDTRKCMPMLNSGCYCFLAQSNWGLPGPRVMQWHGGYSWQRLSQTLCAGLNCPWQYLALIHFGEWRAELSYIRILSILISC